MFVHLNLHTEYSVKDSIIRIDTLCSDLQKNQGLAIAITDWGNIFASIKLYKQAIASGLKPIIGCELNISDADDIFRITVLCKNNIGYKNLCHLIAESHLRGEQGGIATVKREWLDDHHSGLIVLSGGIYGDVGQAIAKNDLDKAKKHITQWQQLLADDYYIELHRVGLAQESNYIREIIPLAKQCQVACVATNLVRFPKQEDFEAHEARVCIHQGYILEDNARPREYTEQQYLKSPEQMLQLFSDIPQAIYNSVIIAQRCNFQFQLGIPIFPKYEVANVDIKEYFYIQAKDGLQKRLEYITNHDLYTVNSDIYTDRLQIELNIIATMGFVDYFLVVADFIRWARETNIPVGPGRGSGAGSLVAYALGITELDPIKFELLFERFLNPERVSLPDFDIDFCMDKRDHVIEYVAKKYGEDCVSQIITYGTMAAKAVVRDVGRILNHSYGFVDSIAKCIPFEIGMTLDKALDQSDDFHTLYSNNEEAKIIIDMAKKLEGTVRNVGKHAGGVVIAPASLTEYIPLYSDQEGLPVSGFDKNDTEDIGLVKFDFLGLRTLTIIDWTIKSIRQRYSDQQSFDISAINLDDKETFNLLKKCQTSAVFQLESRGMKDLIKRLQPDTFEDIIALVALFRPGPLQSGMVDSFVARKHGLEKIEYLHPDLESVLQPTYGVILYQEQVMQIARVLAGYSLGEADLLRRAMGKKKAEEMAKHRIRFVEGSVKNKIDSKQAEFIFDLMEKFAGYGFNKSHSAAYALIAYQTAWLKTHYPAEFMAAVLSSDLDNTDKIVMFIDECKQMGITIEPPCINSSYYAFTVKNNTTLRYGLGAIKGIGEGAIDNVVTERKNGLFSSLLDLCMRADLHLLNKRCFEPLIYSGGCDCLQLNRASLLASFADVSKYSEKSLKDKKHGQKDLFGSISQAPVNEHVILKERSEWPLQQKLEFEKSVLGWYCSDHPINCYADEISQIAPKKITTILSKTASDIIFIGILVSTRIIYTKKGNKMAIATLEDGEITTNVTIFPDLLAKINDALISGNILVVKGDVKFDKFSDSNKVIATKLLTLEEFRLKYLKTLHINVANSQCSEDFINKLQHILSPYRSGKCKVLLKSTVDEKTAQQYLFSEKWNLVPSCKLIDELQQLCGSNNVTFNYFA